MDAMGAMDFLGAMEAMGAMDSMDAMGAMATSNHRLIVFNQCEIDMEMGASQHHKRKPSIGRTLHVKPSNDPANAKVLDVSGDA